MASSTRLHYQAELAELEERCLGGIDLVVTSLDRILEAVATQDVELAAIVVADDDRIDGRFLEVHQSMLTMLATQAPVATDLRLIAALLHVMKCIERMGDQCVNIAKLIPLSDAGSQDQRLIDNIAAMGGQVRSLCLQSRRAFAERDLELARDLVRQDDLVDRLNREVFGLALEFGDSLQRREWAMTMLLACRALERIGDNAVDIGEQLGFLVTGKLREFEDASHPRAPAER